MRRATSFDYREFLGRCELPTIDPTLSRKLVAGVSTSTLGLALVILCKDESEEHRLESFATVGPLTDGWNAFARFVAGIRSAFEPPAISRLYVRREACPHSDIERRIFIALRKHFPHEFAEVNAGAIQGWIDEGSITVEAPKIPEADEWTNRMLREAAETVFYAECGSPAHLWSAEVGDGLSDGLLARNFALAQTGETQAGSSLALPPSSSVAGPEFRSATAISFTKPFLHMVTAVQEESGRIVIDPARTTAFRFESREADDLRQLHTKIAFALSSWRVDRIGMRVGPNRGQYMLHPLAYRIEGAVQLLEGVRVETHSLAAISGFLRKHDPLLPPPQNSGLGAVWRQGQIHAIGTAAYSLHLAGLEGEGGQ
jgi:hypothetical protein